jgi:hypothetical protein
VVEIELKSPGLGLIRGVLPAAIGVLSCLTYIYVQTLTSTLYIRARIPFPLLCFSYISVVENGREDNGELLSLGIVRQLKGDYEKYYSAPCPFSAMSNLLG